MDPVAAQAPVAIQAMMTAVGQALWPAGPDTWTVVPEISARVVAALCSAVWEGALLAGVVALGLRLMPRLTAAARSLVWLNVFALVAGLHVVPLMMGRGAGSWLWAILLDSMRPGSIHSESIHGALIHPALFNLDPRWSVAVAAVWAALTVWRLAELAASAVSLRGVARRATVVDAGETVRALLNGKNENGRRGRGAELCTSDEVERPCVIGFFRPRVLIPEALLGALSEVELGQVLLHEMEHVRRWDDWRNLAQKVGVAVFPLNPALAWVEHRLCTERELACDDRVLRASAERKTYALCLARVAEFSLVNRGLALALGAWGRRPELVKRVQRILRRPAETHTGRMAGLGAAAMTLAALGCAAVLARSPEVVTFAPRPHAAVMARVQPTAGTQVGEAARVHEAPMNATSARMERSAPEQARVVMAKAVIPEKPAKATPAVARVKQTGPDAELVKTRAEMRRELRTQQFVMTTEWERIEVPQLVITVQQENRPAYAAVPFGNGWLIVQI